MHRIPCPWTMTAIFSLCLFLFCFPTDGSLRAIGFNSNGGILPSSHIIFHIPPILKKFPCLSFFFFVRPFFPTYHIPHARTDQPLPLSHTPYARHGGCTPYMGYAYYCPQQCISPFPQKSKLARSMNESGESGVSGCNKQNTHRNPACAPKVKRNTLGNLFSSSFLFQIY